MIAPRNPLPVEVEQFVARLTAAAYEVALRHGVRGPFLDLELGLWRALRTAAVEQLAVAEAGAWPR
jgi:hypothetical protein